MNVLPSSMLVARTRRHHWQHSFRAATPQHANSTARQHADITFLSPPVRGLLAPIFSRWTLAANVAQHRVGLWHRSRHATLRWRQA